MRISEGATYYQKLINGECGPDEPYILLYKDVNVRKLMLNKLINLGVLLNDQFHSFVGLPLRVDGRYFGIIRILFNSKLSEIF